MTREELMHMHEQVRTLSEVARDYPGRTIENIIQNLDARIKANER